jgi:hypothetical protein
MQAQYFALALIFIIGDGLSSASPLNARGKSTPGPCNICAGGRAHPGAAQWRRGRMHWLKRLDDCFWPMLSKNDFEGVL